MTLSDRRFKVEKYIDMARISKNEALSSHFLSMAEHHLEVEDEYQSSGLTETDNYILSMGQNEFIDVKIGDAYLEYMRFCKVNGFNMETKRYFSKQVKALHSFGAIHKRFGDVVNYVFIKE